jgi:hypothetical protein
MGTSLFGGTAYHTNEAAPGRPSNRKLNALEMEGGFLRFRGLSGTEIYFHFFSIVNVK